MEKIDTIELLLAEVGYQRKTETIGYHPTLSRTISSFRHYLKPLDFFGELYKSEEQQELSEQQTLTARKVYTHDAFLVHSKQYGDTSAKVEVTYRIKDGLESFLREELREDPPVEAVKPKFFDKLFNKSFQSVLGDFQYRKNELFSNEDDAIKVLTLYVEKCRTLVDGDAGAMQRLGMLAELSGFKQMTDLAIIAKDTSDTDMKMFLSFLAKNEDMDIVIRDYKQAYNVFTMVDKSQFSD